MIVTLKVKSSFLVIAAEMEYKGLLVKEAFAFNRAALLQRCWIKYKIDGPRSHGLLV